MVMSMKSPGSLPHITVSGPGEGRFWNCFNMTKRFTQHPWEAPIGIRSPGVLGFKAEFHISVPVCVAAFQ